MNTDKLVTITDLKSQEDFRPSAPMTAETIAALERMQSGNGGGFSGTGEWIPALTPKQVKERAAMIAHDAAERRRIEDNLVRHQMPTPPKARPSEALTFGQAGQKLFDNGYAPIDVGWGEEVPSGPWSTYLFSPNDAAPSDSPYVSSAAERGVAIITGLVPVEGSAANVGEQTGGLDYVKSTHLITLQFVTSDKKLATAADALVVPRLRWADGVTTRHAPQRLGTAPAFGWLRVFRLDDEARFDGARTQRYRLPKDKPSYTFHGHEAIAEGAGSCFVLSADLDLKPYRWTESLLDVPIGALPLMSASEASDIISALDGLLMSRAA